MFKRILVLAPHTDDGEFGCGGSIVKFIEEGNEVYYAAFSSAEKSVPQEFPKDILKTEVKEATGKLGINGDHLILFDFEVRKFPELRQEILEKMVKLNRDIQPDLVIMPSTNDTHQDHNTISQEGFRAFKQTSIWGYEIPWNNLTFHTNIFVNLSEEQVEKKITALECYKSQMHRNYASAEFVHSLATVRGTQIGVKYAEVFDAIRLVIK